MKRKRHRVELWFGLCFVWKIICGGLLKIVSKTEETQLSKSRGPSGNGGEGVWEYLCLFSSLICLWYYGIILSNYNCFQSQWMSFSGFLLLFCWKWKDKRFFLFFILLCFSVSISTITNVTIKYFFLIKAYVDLAIPITVYMVRKFYFILIVNHVRIFHLLLDDRDYIDTISKGPRWIWHIWNVKDQIDI